MPSSCRLHSRLGLPGYSGGAGGHGLGDYRRRRGIISVIGAGGQIERFDAGDRY
jgi:hypothetical protein